MPNFVSLLKSEIFRLARREAKRLVSPLKAQVKQLRRVTTEQKVRVAELERRHAQTARQAAAASTGKSTKPGAVGDGTRLGPRSIRAQRARLGLSQIDLARLVGVSHITIYNWESGRAKPRGENRNALVGVRELGRRDVKTRLAEAPVAKKGKARRAAKRARSSKGMGRRGARA